MLIKENCRILLRRYLLRDEYEKLGAHIRRHAARLLTVLSACPKVQEVTLADKIWCKGGIKMFQLLKTLFLFLGFWLVLAERFICHSSTQSRNAHCRAGSTRLIRFGAAGQVIS
ncbi:hypothetical protein Droror1_Dr00025094 [Drosera rotundifolia]